MLKRILIICFILGIANANAIEKNDWQILLKQIPEQYILSVDVEQNAIWLLKSLKSLDKNFTVADDKNKLTLYYKGKVLKSLYKPEDKNDIEKWNSICTEFTDLIFKNSSIAANHDFEATDLIMHSYIKNLDKDSKYYSSISDMEETLHRVNFYSKVEDDILWIKIRLFNKNTKSDITKALTENDFAKGVVLDLRGSNGGELSTAIAVADIFLEEGIVVSVIGQKQNEIIYYNSKDGDIAENVPVVILVDGDTASAAEVLAIALQEQKLAKVIGTQTYGKGTTQKLIRLSNGGILALSNAHIYTPSGNKMTDEVLIPDVCTSEMPDSKDVVRLLSMGKNEKCHQESRAEADLEVKIAKELLKI